MGYSKNLYKNLENRKISYQHSCQATAHYGTAAKQVSRVRLSKSEQKETVLILKWLCRVQAERLHVPTRVLLKYV